MIIRCLASGSSGNCIVLEENGKLVLLDVGIRLADIKKGIQYRVSDVEFFFVSHRHIDHRLSDSKLEKMGIDGFQPYKCENQIQVFKKHGWYLRSFPLPHGEDVKNCGTYIMSPEGHKLLYLVDFQYSAYKFTKLAIDTIIIECNHDDVIEKDENEGHWEHSVRNHSSISTVCEFLRVNRTDNLKTVILAHISENNLNVKDAVFRVKEAVGSDCNVFVADKGVTIDTDE